MNLPHRIHAHLAPTLLAVTVGLILAGCGGEPHTVTAQPDAAPVDQSVPPQAQKQPSAPSAPSASRAADASTNDRAGPQGPAVVAEPGGSAQATEQQIDALRKRLEARRAKQQQQQQEQQPQSPAKNQ